MLNTQKEKMTSPTSSSPPAPFGDLHKTQVVTFVTDLRDRICAAFEKLEADLVGTRHLDHPVGTFRGRHGSALTPPVSLVAAALCR